MPRVLVLTEGGQTVYDSWDRHLKLDGIVAARIPSSPTHVTTHSLLRGIARAIEDAEKLEAGLDPERLSEKAMRLAEEAA